MVLYGTPRLTYKYYTSLKILARDKRFGLVLNFFALWPVLQNFYDRNSIGQYYKTTIVVKASLRQPQLVLASSSQPYVSLNQPQLALASLSQPLLAFLSPSQPQIALNRIVNYDHNLRSKLTILNLLQYRPLRGRQHKGEIAQWQKTHLAILRSMVRVQHHRETKNVAKYTKRHLPHYIDHCGCCFETLPLE